MRVSNDSYHSLVVRDHDGDGLPDVILGSPYWTGWRLRWIKGTNGALLDSSQDL